MYESSFASPIRRLPLGDYSLGHCDCQGRRLATGDIATTLGTGLGIGAIVWFGLLAGGVYLAYRLVTSDFGKDVAKSAILTRVGKR